VNYSPSTGLTQSFQNVMWSFHPLAHQQTGSAGMTDGLQELGDKLNDRLPQALFIPLSLCVQHGSPSVPIIVPSLALSFHALGMLLSSLWDILVASEWRKWLSKLHSW
jgi:hypothetical protein